MNKCILKGRIIENINFEFLYASKYISVAMTNILLKNNSQILIYRI